jgi:hypothetical protein
VVSFFSSESTLGGCTTCSVPGSKSQVDVSAWQVSISAICLSPEGAISAICLSPEGAISAICLSPEGAISAICSRLESGMQPHLPHLPAIVVYRVVTFACMHTGDSALLSVGI